jgi:hypothetical protein
MPQRKHNANDLLVETLTYQQKADKVVDFAIKGLHPDEIARELELTIPEVMTVLEAGTRASHSRFQKVEFLRSLNLLRLEEGLKAISPLALQGVPHTELNDKGESTTRYILDDRYYTLFLKTIELQMRLLDKLEDKQSKRQEEEQGGFQPTLHVHGDIIIERDAWMSRYKDMGAADLINMALQPGQSHPSVMPSVVTVERQINKLMEEED